MILVQFQANEGFVIGHLMSYFKTSYSTLQKLAKTLRYEDVAGFLVLARHASGREVAGLPPYKLSGAGVNSIHEKACVSEETARGVIQRLQEGGFIKPATPEMRKAFAFARWEIVQDELDLDLPHALLDPPKNSPFTTPMRRVKESNATAAYASALTGTSDTELRLDTLMVLLGIYKHTDMEAFGGLNPNCAYRGWTIKSQIPNEKGIRWGAEPDESSTARAYVAFMEECSKHWHRAAPKGKVSEPLKARFWNAWTNVQEKGLVYEAVELFDANPKENPQARMRFSLRINDYHAGSIKKAGDPSLLGTFESLFGTEMAFYTAKENERSETESMWLILPDKRGSIVGVWRPRFRTATPNVGAWLDKEKENIEGILRSLTAPAS